MVQHAIPSRTEVATRPTRPREAPTSATEGPLATLRAESEALLARGRRVLSARRFWSSVAERFSPMGVALPALAGQLDAIAEAGTRDEGEPDGGVIPLPGVSLTQGHAFYAGHWLGRISPEVEAAWNAGVDATPADLATLVAHGLATGGAPPVDAGAFSLVVVPHCDDAALALGGTLAARLRVERPVFVEVFTVSSWLDPALRARSPEDVTQLRRREESLSAQLLGAATLGLGFWDVDCRTYQRAACDGVPPGDDFRWAVDPALRPPEELDRMRSGLRMAVRRLLPRRIYLPLGLGGQADHQLIASLAAWMAPAFAAECPEIVFYEDQPYASAPGVDAEGVAREHGLIPETVDVSATFERKMQAVSAHRSQFSRASIEPPLRAHAAQLAAASGLPAGSLAERLWRLRKNR